MGCYAQPKPFALGDRLSTRLEGIRQVSNKNKIKRIFLNFKVNFLWNTVAEKQNGNTKICT